MGKGDTDVRENYLQYPHPRITLDDDGTLDDFYATQVESVHFEALDESQWYINIVLNDGQQYQIN